MKCIIWYLKTDKYRHTMSLPAEVLVEYIYPYVGHACTGTPRAELSVLDLFNVLHLLPTLTNPDFITAICTVAEMLPQPTHMDCVTLEKIKCAANYVLEKLAEKPVVKD